jgi:hypothetical protein
LGLSLFVSSSPSEAELDSDDPFLALLLDLFLPYFLFFPTLCFSSSDSDPFLVIFFLFDSCLFCGFASFFPFYLPPPIRFSGVRSLASLSMCTSSKSSSPPDDESI